MCSIIGIQREGAGLLAGNYDFYYPHGLVVTNRRGLYKQALSDSALAPQWQSRFGSITLNQFGRELPSSGMNEAGLAVHMAQVQCVRCPEPLGPGLSELQWIQYQLDRYASVAEAVAGLADMVPSPVYIDLHYALCDSHGAMAVVECVNGQWRALPAAHPRGLVMTNHPVARELEWRASGLGKAPYGVSARRFQQLWGQLDALTQGTDPAPGEPGVPADPALHFLVRALASVGQPLGIGGLLKWLLLRNPPSYTCWRSLYDTAQGEVYIRPMRAKVWHRLALRNLDLGPGTGVLGEDIEHLGVDPQSPVSPLRPIRREDNARIIRASYRPLGKRGLTEQEMEALIDYPDRFQVASQAAP